MLVLANVYPLFDSDSMSDLSPWERIGRMVPSNSVFGQAAFGWLCFCHFLCTLTYLESEHKSRQVVERSLLGIV